MLVQPMGKVCGPGGGIRNGVNARRVQAFNLTGNTQRAVGLHVVIERFHAEPVARAEEPTGPRVPDQKREHADESLQARVAPALISSQNDLRIGSASKLVLS